MHDLLCPDTRIGVPLRVLDQLRVLQPRFGEGQHQAIGVDRRIAKRQRQECDGELAGPAQQASEARQLNRFPFHLVGTERKQ